MLLATRECGFERVIHAPSATACRHQLPEDAPFVCRVLAEKSRVWRPLALCGCQAEPAGTSTCLGSNVRYLPEVLLSAVHRGSQPDAIVPVSPRLRTRSMVDTAQA